MKEEPRNCIPSTASLPRSEFLQKTMDDAPPSGIEHGMSDTRRRHPESSGLLSCIDMSTDSM